MRNIIQTITRKKTWKIIGFAFVVLLCLTVAWCLERITTLSEENSRISSVILLKNETITELKILNGQTAYQSQVLELRLNELSALFPQIMREIQNLKIKPSRAQTVSSTVYASEKHIKTELRDSVIFDSIPVKVFAYSDQWYNIKGVSQNEEQKVTIQMQDTLVQAVFRGEREKPWLWVLSPRKLQQRVSLKNPNTTIVYTQFIEIQNRSKRRK